MPEPSLAYVACAITGPPVNWRVKSGFAIRWVVAVYFGWSLDWLGRVIERTLLNVPEEWTWRSGRDEGAAELLLKEGGSVW